MVLAMSNFDDIFDPVPQNEDFDKEAWAAKKKAERDEVYALADEMATEAVSNGEIFRIYLGMQAQFPNYSATNVLLILAQNGDATKLRDYEGWANCGYFVKKDESAISILEPGKTYTTKDGRTGTYYEIKKVFDISQTNARPYTPAPVQYDARMLLSALAAKRPVPIEMADELSEGAVYDRTRHRILVRRGMDTDALFRCLSKSLAEAELEQREIYEAEKAPFQSECIAYMLSRRYGVENDGSAFEQLPDWLRKTEPRKIRDELSKMSDTMRCMLGRLEKALEQAKQEKQKER